LTDDLAETLSTILKMAEINVPLEDAAKSADGIVATMVIV
jgi:hypothetical protein